MDPNTGGASRWGKRITLITRLRYALDNTLSRGPAGLIVWLGFITLALVLGATAFIAAAQNDPDKDFVYILWNVLYQTITPNPVDPKTGSNTFLFTMLFATLSSLLLVSILIGILTNAIDNRIENLRKGRSFVIERDHILILGWSPKIFGIISELVIANLHHRRPRIVVLADKDKVEMEDEIRARVGRTHNTHVICRSGSPIDLNDLDIVNPQASRSIIILSPEDEDPDSQIIKTILAVVNHPDRRPEPYHVVAEIREPKHMEIAHLVGGDEARLVLASDLISRITVQASRQSGLSVVYSMLLNFQDDGIYFISESRLSGRTYGEALSAYEDSAVIGLLHGEKEVVLNPPPEMHIATDDKLIVISKSDITARLAQPVNLDINASAICEMRPRPTKPERTLILGWNTQTQQVMCELDKYVAPGSAAVIVSDNPDGGALTALSGQGLRHLSVSHQGGDITERSLLEALNVQDYDHVIILSDSKVGDVQKADALTLVTLLHLRGIADRYGHRFSIVTEMMDVRNRRLAEVTKADDFIVSDMFTGLMLAQVSENEHLMDVFNNLFDAETASIYLKPAGRYITPGAPVNFYTVIEAASRCGETAIGYRLHARANDSAQSYGVVINPHKAAVIAFDERDRVIVLQG